MGPSFAAKALFITKQIGFAAIKYKNEQYFNLVYVHEPKFGVLDFFCDCLSRIFSCPFSFVFLDPFILATSRISYSYWLIDYGQSRELGPR